MKRIAGSILVLLMGCTPDTGKAPESARAPLAVTQETPTLPIGVAPPGRQTGAIAVDGACAASALCREVSAVAIRAVYAQVRKALSLRHRPGGASPHYGGRSIEVVFGGGQCEIGDSSDGPITAEDMPAFDGAFDAIVNAYVGASEPRSR